MACNKVESFANFCENLFWFAAAVVEEALMMQWSPEYNSSPHDRLHIVCETFTLNKLKRKNFPQLILIKTTPAMMPEQIKADNVINFFPSLH